MTNVVFVSNADSGDISVLHLDAKSGSLTAQQTVSAGGKVMPLAVSPDRRFLYAARRSDPLAVLSFAIDPANGELSPLGVAPLPDSMANIATDRSGRFLLSASYGGNVIAVSPIAANGVVQAAQQVLSTEPKAHAIHTDPSNRFVFATSLGGGHLMQLRFDAATGMLTPNTPPLIELRTASGPRHFVFHPNGKFVFVLNELDASIDVLALDTEHGTLRLLHSVDARPPHLQGEAWSADVHLTPDGRFLYASERHTSTLAGFAVGAADGRVSSIGHTVCEAEPRGFAIDPGGRFLLTAGQASHHVGVHGIDPRTGGLTPLSRTPVGRAPNWVEVISMG